MKNKKHNLQKDWKHSKKLIAIITAIFLIGALIVFYLYSSFITSYECEKKIHLLRIQHPEINLNEQVQAPSGFSISQISLGLKKQVECEREHKKFFIF